MNWFYTFIIAFSIVFFSELGDKTQLLVLSFSTKDRARNILFGVALGTFLSHGLAILFGSQIGSLQNPVVKYYLQLFTYSSFLLFGLLGFIPKKEKASVSCQSSSKKSSFLEKIFHFKINYVLLVALAIIVGELGDKTFLASLGLGVQYPNYKLSLILGSISGMVLSNSFALFFGKLVGNKLKPQFIEFLSNLIFIIFGIIGFVTIFLSSNG